MTIHAFNRRIEVTSTYHVRRRNRRKPGVSNVWHATFWCAALSLTVGTALLRLGGVL